MKKWVEVIWLEWAGKALQALKKICVKYLGEKKFSDGLDRRAMYFEVYERGGDWNEMRL